MRIFCVWPSWSGSKNCKHPRLIYGNSARVYPPRDAKTELAGAHNGCDILTMHCPPAARIYECSAAIIEINASRAPPYTIYSTFRWATRCMVERSRQLLKLKSISAREKLCDTIYDATKNKCGFSRIYILRRIFFFAQIFATQMLVMGLTLLLLI